MPKIESLAHGELIRLAIQMRERILIYEGTIFRSKEREFGKSSERGSIVFKKMFLVFMSFCALAIFLF